MPVHLTSITLDGEKLIIQTFHNLIGNVPFEKLNIVFKQLT
jgi:hypothetical protein